MPETKQIPTKTILTNTSTAISIFTFYSEGVPNILDAFISHIVSSKNGTSYIEGQLIITAKNYPTDINFYLDGNGNLIIVGDDADHYSLNSNGDLIYTF